MIGRSFWKVSHLKANLKKVTKGIIDIKVKTITVRIVYAKIFSKVIFFVLSISRPGIHKRPVKVQGTSK